MFSIWNCIIYKQVSWHRHGQIINTELKVIQTEMIAFQKISTNGEMLDLHHKGHTLLGFEQGRTNTFT